MCSSFLITYLSFAPSVGCDPSQGFFLKENFHKAQMGTTRDNILKNVKG
jgi:hypothetical protein